MPETIIYENADVRVWQDDTGRQRLEPQPGTNAANRQQIVDAARTALIANRAFNAITTPTNAQVLTQVRALTRQMNGAIRVLLDAYDSTD